MNVKEIRNALKNGKPVSNRDYDTLLHMDGYSRVISYLTDRFKITKNPKIEIEIQRLKSIMPHQVNKENEPVADKSSPKGNKSITRAQPVDKHLNYGDRDTKTEIRQLKSERSRQTQKSPDPFYHKPDNERFLYVHHDNEPYVDRTITLPVGDKEREDYLLKVSLDNWDLYDFLKYG